MPPVIELSDQPNLVKTKDFPSYAKFGFEEFNPVQSRVAEHFNKDANFLIASSTGSGKTVIAEMTIAHEINERKGKAIYLAPMRSLAREKIEDWADKNHHFHGKKLSICTGDFRLTAARKKELDNADIILMTNEMLAARCRNYQSEQSEFLNEVGTLICDEIHLLGSNRGPHTEVALMKFCKLNPKCRIIGLSATLPNVQQIAEWVSYVLTGKETFLLKSTFRPIPLGMNYETFWDGGSYDDIEMEKIHSAITIRSDYQDDKCLIFVHTKKTGQLMKKALEEAGFACEFHSADLEKEKRHKVEKEFRAGKLHTIIATSTLAWGCFAHGTKINLPRKRMCDPIPTMPIEEITEGMLVESLVFNTEREDNWWRDSWCSTDFEWVCNKVLKVKDLYKESAIQIILEDGKSAVVSEDHKFLIRSYKGGFDWICVTELSLDHSIGIQSDRGFLKWIKIKYIEPVQGGMFRDIEVEGTHNYVGAGMISHNCNLPARRVIITGLTRGLDEVDNYDLMQMAGRSGRPGYDPRGDAYFLVPQSTAAECIKKIQTPQKIESQLLKYIGTEKNPHYKNLAFHIVSEVHHQFIETNDDMHTWFERSLAYFQAGSLSQDIVDKTTESLLKCKAMRQFDDKYVTTIVGTIASLYYYSPFDVADLKKNFSLIFDNNYQDNDLMVSIALANVDTIRLGIVSKAERMEMGMYTTKMEQIFGKGNVMETAIKGGYAYYTLLHGINTANFGAICRNFQGDYERLNMVLNALDYMGLKWNKKDWFSSLKMRIAYGVRTELVDLCRLPDVGKARAEKLWASGIRNVQQVADNPAKVQQILKLKNWNEIVEEAKKLALVK